MSRDSKRSREGRDTRKQYDSARPQYDKPQPRKKQFSHQTSDARKRPQHQPRGQRPNPSSRQKTPSAPPKNQTIETFLRIQRGNCGPLCPDRAFKCQKRAMGRRYKDVKGRLQVECNFIEDEPCEGPRCQFAFCIKHQLRSNGKCGFYGKKKEKSASKWDEEEQDELTPNKELKNYRFQDKALKKMRKYKDYENY